MSLLPLFLNLTGRAVLLVGAGRVAEGKLQQLLAAGARVRVVAPAVSPTIRAVGVEIVERGFLPSDLEGIWLVVAAANPEVNRAVADAAEIRQIFVNAVDDPANASAFLSGVVRRAGVTIAISTSGEAPALTALLREALDAVLPDDLEGWVAAAREQRAFWRRTHVPIEQRKPLLLRRLNRLYPSAAADADGDRGAPKRADEDPGVRVPCEGAERGEGALRATEPGREAEPYEGAHGARSVRGGVGWRGRRGEAPRSSWDAPEDSWL